MNTLKIQVQVTQEHIDKGIKHNCTNCPVALAVVPLFPFNTVKVGAYSIWLEEGTKKEQEIKMPDEATIFIHEFDFENPVSPFTFELELDAEQFKEETLDERRVLVSTS